MATKENKGGLLTNEQVEADNRAKGKTEGPYVGAQDTGDKEPRSSNDDTMLRSGDEAPQNEERGEA